MSYSRLLMKVIAESGYTNKQIIEKCNEKGRKIDKAYLSRVVNGKVSAPSEELSRILANVCNIDERILVIEGYIEKAPKEIKEAFLSIKLMTYMITTNIFENKLDEKNLQELKEKLQEEPLADFIISLIDEKNIEFPQDSIDIIKEQDDSIKMTLSEPLALTVNDNSMFPKIVQGSKILLKLENNYNDWDILAIKVKNEENIIVRFAFIDQEKIILKALNHGFETLTYNLKDVVILGKVSKVIVDL